MAILNSQFQYHFPFHKQFSNTPTLLRFGKTQVQTDKPYVGFYDVDDTFLALNRQTKQYDTVALRETVDVILKYQASLSNWWNTGRSPAEINKITAEHPEINEQLNRFSLDGLIANYGSSIFVNNTHAPTADWIRSLESSDQDQVWKTQVNWNPENVNKGIENSLQNAGYTELTLTPLLPQFAFPFSADNIQAFTKEINSLPGYVSIVYLIQDQQTLRFTFRPLVPAPKETIYDATFEQAKPELHQIKKNIESSLKGINIDCKIISGIAHYNDRSSGSNDQNSWYQIFVRPTNADKASSTQFVLNHYAQNTQAVITAGDSPMMDKVLLQGKYTQHGQELPNIAIACHAEGKDPVLESSLQEEGTEFISALPGNLDQALPKAIKRAQQSQI